MVNPERSDTEWNQTQINFRDFVKLPIYVDFIYARIDTQMLKNSQDILVHLENLENGINPDIGTLKK